MILAACGSDAQDGCGVAADWDALRTGMIGRLRAHGGVGDARVLEAMHAVPRHAFVPEGRRGRAYSDDELPIGHGQSISSPHIVAVMTELAEIKPTDRVLEIGTGSGYGAAVLAELAAEVYTIEILEPLANEARARLEKLGYGRVKVRAGDGYQGWKEHAPFDAIIVTAAPPRVPDPLKQQLAEGGRLVVPVGTQRQHLRVITRTPGGGFDERPLAKVRFGAMTGEAQERD